MRGQVSRTRAPGAMAPERACCDPVPDRFTSVDHTDSVGPCIRVCATQALLPKARGHRGKRALPTLHIKTGKNRNAHRLDPILKELQRLERESNVKSVHNTASVSPA